MGRLRPSVLDRRVDQGNAVARCRSLIVPLTQLHADLGDTIETSRI
jgi:hypothetical protein